MVGCLVGSLAFHKVVRLSEAVGWVARRVKEVHDRSMVSSFFFFQENYFNKQQALYVSVLLNYQQLVLGLSLGKC